ncbi:MAG: hypothetical protein K0U54_05630 [Bacteroidetes bacterium]|nr:hypothetical protein [Bacteroidota bacterium]
MRKTILVLIALLFAAAAAYFFFAEGHREDIGELEIYSYDAKQKYCVYKIIAVDTADSHSMKIGTKICIVCTEDWPGVEVGGEKQCWSRITFGSASGQYVYDADLFDSLQKGCTACTDAAVYYNKP